MKLKFIFGLGLLATLTLASCDKEKVDTDLALENLQKQVLHDEAYEVIIPTYQLLETKAQALKDAITALRQTQTPEKLEAARQAWRDARIPWEQSESFLFGPTGEKGLDPALDSWPVDVPAMNAVLNSQNPITAETLEANDESRGFHLIEFLLWGEDSNKSVADLNARQLEYLEAAAQDVLNNAKKLVKHWTPYAETLSKAGQDGNLKYPSLESGFQQLVAGMIEISNEVASAKIENPLNGDAEAGTNDNQPHPDLEESRFSNNSKRDYVNNIESIANVYEGKFNGKDVKGIDEVVIMLGLKNNPKLITLNENIKDQIKKAQQAIEAIPVSFSDAIRNNRDAVKFAQQETQKLTALLEQLNKEAFHASAPAEK